MQQTTFSDIEYSNRRRKTKREQFLDSMDSVIPWEYWIEQIRPYYPSGKRGRPPRDIELMLRMYLLQRWFRLSDEGMEDAISDSYSMRRFMNLDFFHEQVPSASTLLKFRHLMETCGLGNKLYEDVKKRLEQSGHILREGRIVDAGIVNIPSPAKRKKERKEPDHT